MEKKSYFTEKTIKLSKFLKPILFVLCSVILEIINMVVVFGSFLPKYFFFDFSIYMIFAGIIFLIPKDWLANIFSIIFFLPQLILSVVNLTLRDRIQAYFIFDMLNVVGDGIAAFNIKFLPIGLIVGYSLFLIFAFLGLSLLDKYISTNLKIKTFKKIPVSLMFFHLTLILSLISFSCQILIINNGKNYDRFVSDKMLWDGEIVSTSQSIKTFGVYGFYLNNFYNTYLKTQTYDENFLLKYASGGEVNRNATLFDDNLILITLESFDEFAIDPYNTPNIWNLINGNSVYMSEFYGKNQTNVSEMIALLGYMPDYLVYDSEVGSLSSNYSLANLFNELGYTTSYFHSYSKEFYNREFAMQSLGYQNIYFADDTESGLNFDLNSLKTEGSFFEYFKEEMIPTDGSKFFTTYMTVGTHGDYRTNPNFQKYYKKFKSNYKQYREWFDNETDFTYPEEKELLHYFENFKAQCMETDEMIGNLFKYLNETEVNGTKLIDNTTVILYADHDCYYHDISANLRKSTAKDDLYNIPFLICSKKLESRTINSFCSTFDIYPTICELFGLAYNKNMCLGGNIFDENFDGIFYTVKDNVGIFDSTYKLLQFENLYYRYSDIKEKESIEEFVSKVNNLLQKQKYLNQIYISKLKT